MRMCRFVLTPGTMGSLGQTGKRFGFLGTLASWWLGWHDWLTRGSDAVGPQTAEHEKDAHQRHEPEVVEKEGWYHGNAPADDGVRGALYRGLGLSELSAAVLYTTNLEGSEH